jgi:hypothetical protein
VHDTFGRILGELDPAGIGMPVALRSGTDVVGFLEEEDSVAPSWIVRTPDTGVAARYHHGVAPFGTDPAVAREWWSAHVEPTVSGALRALAVAAPVALALGRI